MALRRPLVVDGGQVQELGANDTLHVPTQDPGDNTNAAASTAFVKAVVSGVALTSCSYDDRGGLRSNVSGSYAIVDSLGLFKHVVGSDEPDDDESCFATDSGRWLLEAAHWDLIDAWRMVDEEAQNDAIEDSAKRDPLKGKFLTGSAVCAITGIAPQNAVSFTGSAPGAVPGDRVVVTPPDRLEGTTAGGRLSFYAWVSAPDVVTVEIGNASSSTVTTNIAIRTAWPLTVIKA